MQIVIDISSNMRQHNAIFISHCLYLVLDYTKHMAINANPKLDNV
jgi:hypothetical protein